MTKHDELCRYQHMDVATELDDQQGCDCPIIAVVKEAEQKLRWTATKAMVDQQMRDEWNDEQSQRKALARLLLDSGDITPMGARLLTQPRTTGR